MLQNSKSLFDQKEEKEVGKVVRVDRLVLCLLSYFCAHAEAPPTFPVFVLSTEIIVNKFINKKNNWSNEMYL